MRFFTPVLLLICTVLLSSAFEAIAQPVYTITNVKNECGDLKNASFTIHVTAATGDLTIVVAGPGGYFKSTPFLAGTYTLPFDYTPPPVPAINPGLDAQDAGSNYNILASDATNNTLANVTLYNFSIDPGATIITNNSNADCSPPNGAIDVSLRLTSDPNAITYLWSPGGQMTQDISGIGGGSYVLTYSDGTNSCPAAPIVLIDPSPTDFHISAPPTVCDNSAFDVIVDVVDQDYTYTVLEGAAVLGTYVASSSGVNVPITVGPLASGSHTLTVSAKQGGCLTELNQPGDPTVQVSATPVYTTPSAAVICSGDPTGFDVNSLRGSSILATSFQLVTTTFGTLTPGPGLPVADGSSISATDLADDVWTNKDNVAHDVVYTVATFANGCPGNVITVTFTINPEPVAPADTPKAICSGDAVAFNLQTDAIDLGNALAGTTFSWTAADNTNVSGESAGAQVTATINDALVNLTSSNQVVVYTVIPTSPLGCIGDPFTVTVTVNPQPVAPTDIPKTICSNDNVNVNLQTDAIDLGNAIPGITFQWAAADNINVTGEAAGVQTTATIGDVLVNTTSTDQVVVYTVTPTTPGGCEGDPFTVTITVNPEPVAPANTPKTICSADNVAFDLQTDAIDLGNAIAGTTFSWTVADNTDVTGESAGTQTTASIADALVNKSPTAQIVIYTITPTSPAGCDGAPFTVTVTVNPEPVAPADTPKAICSGDNVAFDLQAGAIDSGNAIAGTTFSWTAADNTSVTGESVGTQTTTSIADVLGNTTASNQVVVYTVTPTSPDGCEGAPFTITVTVNLEPVAPNDIPKTICSSDNVNVNLQTDAIDLGNAIPLTTFEWTAADNINVTGEAAGLQTTATIGDILVNLTSVDQVVVYTVTPTSPGGCDGAPFTVTITVNPEPVAPANTPRTICSADNVAFNLQTDAIDLGNAIAGTTFSWTVADNADVTGESAGTQTTATIDDILVNKSSSAQIVIYTITPTSPAGCDGAPFTLTVTVNPEPVAPADTPKVICSGDNVNFNLQTDAIDPGNAIAGTTFSWTAADNANVTGESVGAQTTATIADVLVNTTATNQVVVYTVTPTSPDGCDGTPFTVTVTVNLEPVAPANTPKTICSNDNVNVNLQTDAIDLGNAIPGTTFNWTVADNPNVTGESVGAQSTAIIGDILVNTTSSSEIVVYTISPTSPGGCDGASFTFTITVNPEPVAPADTPKTICSGDNVAFNLQTDAIDLGNAIAGITFNWTVADNANVTGESSGTQTTASIADVLENKSSGPEIVVYTITPTTPAGCDGTPFTVTVTVNPEPVGLTDFPKTICSDDNVALNLQTAIDLGNGIAGNTFSWTVADNTNVTGESVGTQTTATISDALTNTTTVDQAVIYTVTPTSPDGCAGDPFTVTITVSPRPVLAIGQTKDICGGTAAGLEIQTSPVNQPAGTRFKWPDPDGPFGPGSAGDVDMGVPGTIHINDVLINLFAPPLNVTYVVTPYLGTCEGTPQNVVVTVNRPAVVEAGSDENICTDNGPYQLAGSFRALSATTATWSVLSEPSPGHAVIDQPSMTDPSTSTLTATIAGDYVLLLTSDDPPSICGPATDFVTITVIEKPVIAPAQTALVCANDPVNYGIQMVPSGLPSNTLFNWPDPDGSGPAQAGVDVPIGGSGTFHIIDILRNDGTANIDVTYTVTPRVGLCVGDPVDIIVTVKPGPVLALGQTKTICSGDVVNYEIMLNPANSPPGTTFSWPDPDGSGPAGSELNVAADPAGTFHIMDTLYNGTGTASHVLYSVIAKGTNGCNGVVRDVDIVVNPGAIVEAGSPQTTCSNGTITLTGSSFGGSATEGTWTVALNPSGGDGVITQPDLTSPETATFKATVGGQYTLKLTTDAPGGGCSAVSDVVVITVKAANDPSCTGGGSPCDNVSVQPVPTAATCSNADGSVHFNITDNVTGLAAFPVSGDIEITIDGTGSTVLPSPRTNINNPDFDVLGTGTYSYSIVFGDNSCLKTGEFSIYRSGTIGTAEVSDLIDPTCFGETGTATIDVPGETGNILQWSADGIDFHNFVVGNPVSGLPAGLIAVQRAGDPCAAGVIIGFNMPAEIPVEFIPANATCNGTDGTIQAVNTLNGTAPYVFEINGTQTILPADSVFRGLAPGNYDLVVKDTRGCSKTFDPITVGQVIGPATLDTLYVTKAISVPDLPSGSALVGVLPSGLEPYETRLELVQPLFAAQEFLSDWSEVPLNPLNLKFEQSYTNVYAGVYELGLRDAGGCTKTYVINIDVDTQLFIPNVFTPNADGHNDVFYIRNLPADTKLLVTNRWGKEVFKSGAYENDWNGGDTVDGMYYYTLTLGSQSFTGWVEILRGQ